MENFQMGFKNLIFQKITTKLKKVKNEFKSLEKEFNKNQKSSLANPQNHKPMHHCRVLLVKCI